MSNDYKHNPVDAISENEATGEVAEIFADIRKTMRLPILTSIWRILAGIPDGLVPLWLTVKPAYQSGQADAVMNKMLETVEFPLPPSNNFKKLGMKEHHLNDVSSIINVYNRSNSLNFLVLNAVDCKPVEDYMAYPILPVNPPVTPLPPLLSQEKIKATTWSFLLKLNEIGATPDEPGLATIWRHLAYWPDFLHLIYEELRILEKTGAIDRCKQQLLFYALREGAHLAQLFPANKDIPDLVLSITTKYVRHPGLLVRMVVVGQILASWLRNDDIRRL